MNGFCVIQFLKFCYYVSSIIQLFNPRKSDFDSERSPHRLLASVTSSSVLEFGEYFDLFDNLMKFYFSTFKNILLHVFFSINM